MRHPDRARPDSNYTTLWDTTPLERPRERRAMCKDDGAAFHARKAALPLRGICRSRRLPPHGSKWLQSRVSRQRRKTWSAVGGQILDEQNSLACGHRALVSGVSAVALRFLADVGHRQRHSLGHHSGEGHAGGLAAGDVVERLESRLAHDRDSEEVHQRRAGGRKADRSAVADLRRKGSIDAIIQTANMDGSAPS